MPGIFISYRRDDTSGHAGRLFDRLAQRFGPASVFMDVTDIAPGEDFARVIEDSVGTADLLLAMIGPQWLSASDRAGTRRLDDPSDFVRREIAAGLHGDTTVIPVLVRGARMPREDELPEEIRPLARRQAVELSDNRWESDLAEFERALDKRLGEPAGAAVETKSPARFRMRSGLIVAGLVAVVAMLVSVWITSSSKKAVPADHTPQQNDVVPNRQAETAATVADQSTLRQALALPKISRFKLGGQQFEILALRTEPADGKKDVLTILLRMTNNGPYPDGFVNLTTALQFGDQAIAPLSPALLLVAPRSAVDAELSFPLPHSAESAALWAKYGSEETRIPLPLGERRRFIASESIDEYGRARAPQIVDLIASFPVDLPLPQPHELTAGDVRFIVLDMRLDRYNAERAVLEVGLRAVASKESPGGVLFTSDCLRLLVDDVPRASSTFLSELVAAGTTKDAKLEFLLTDAPKKVELVFRYGPADPVRVPFRIPGLGVF
jgi:TIR domain